MRFEDDIARVRELMPTVDLSEGCL